MCAENKNARLANKRSMLIPSVPQGGELIGKIRRPSLRLHLQPELYKPADGFGARADVVLLAPCVDCG
jgi:hypothetical protein